MMIAKNTCEFTNMEVCNRSSIAGLAVRDAILARRLRDTLALCEVVAGSSVITLGGRTPASYASSWNSDSSGNVSLHSVTRKPCTSANRTVKHTNFLSLFD